LGKIKAQPPWLGFFTYMVLDRGEGSPWIKQSVKISFGKNPKEAEAAKARLEAKKAKRRERDTRNKEQINDKRRQECPKKRTERLNVTT
jgi:hypothetical protein